MYVYCILFILYFYKQHIFHQLRHKRKLIFEHRKCVCVILSVTCEPDKMEYELHSYAMEKAKEELRHTTDDRCY